MPKIISKPAKRLLTHLYQLKKMSAEKIAERFDVSIPTVRKWLKEDGLLIANKMTRKLSSLGYRGWDHFFTRNIKVSQEIMAKMLKCSTVTLGKYHRAWRKGRSS